MKYCTKFLFVFLLFSLFFPNQKIEARSGCCSHHGGVCGCGCCDGSGLSATCAPYYPECSGGGRVVIPTSKPIPTYKPVATSRPTRIPTQRIIPTIKPTLTPKPTKIPTLVPTITIVPSPTETVLPTDIPTVVSEPTFSPTIAAVPEMKNIQTQNFLSRLFSWMFKKR